MWEGLTPRRTAIPVKITFAGPNSWKGTCCSTTAQEVWNLPARYLPQASLKIWTGARQRESKISTICLHLIRLKPAPAFELFLRLHPAVKVCQEGMFFQILSCETLVFNECNLKYCFDVRGRGIGCLTACRHRGR